MSKFLDRLRLAKRQAAADLQAEADAAQERANEARAEAEAVAALEMARGDTVASASVVLCVSVASTLEPEPVSFPPAPVCAACGERAAMFLVDVACTWRDEASGEIRRVLASFCCRECWKGWREALAAIEAGRKKQKTPT